MEAVLKKLNRVKWNILGIQAQVRKKLCPADLSEALVWLEDLYFIKKKLRRLQDEVDTCGTPEEVASEDPTFETLFASINKLITNVEEQKIHQLKKLRNDEFQRESYYIRGGQLRLNFTQRERDHLEFTI